MSKEQEKQAKEEKRLKPASTEELKAVVDNARQQLKAASRSLDEKTKAVGISLR
jgi:hypothetical protein